MELRDVRNIAGATAAGFFIATAIAVTLENVRPEASVAVAVAEGQDMRSIFTIPTRDTKIHPPLRDAKQQQENKEHNETIVFWATIAVGGLMGATVGHSWYHFGKPGARHSHSGSTNRQPICYNAK